MQLQECIAGKGNALLDSTADFLSFIDLLQPTL